MINTKPIRLICFCLFVVGLMSPCTALSECAGVDLIETMPEAERSELIASAEAVPYPEGLLWAAERGNTHMTIFGTYHQEHRLTNSHLDALMPYVKSADGVYLEISAPDAKKLQHAIATDPSLMFITEGETMPDLLGPEDWASFSEQMAARQIPSFMAAKFKPVWAIMMLGISPCEAHKGNIKKDGIDQRLGKLTEEIGIPTHSLEDYHTVLTMLEDLPRDKQIELIRISLRWEGDPNDMAYTLLHYYLTQKVALAWQYSEMISRESDSSNQFDVIEERLLTDRNKKWLKLLTGPEGPEGQTAFVAVGAAHLPGKTGMLKLLEDEGFTITPLPFNP